jgi:hypothetical protein
MFRNGTRQDQYCEASLVDLRASDLVFLNEKNRYA